METLPQYFFSISPDHPSLPGHFPGNPVVPGVVLLGEVVRLAAELLGDLRVMGLPDAKFLSPLGPGECCQVRFEPVRLGLVKFHCAVADRPVASGRLEWAPQDTPPGVS